MALGSARTPMPSEKALLVHLTVAGCALAKFASELMRGVSLFAGVLVAIVEDAQACEG
jgi:hypothetical protein